MKFLKTGLEGVTLIEPAVHSDGRGFFLESYHKKVFADNGIGAEFVQDNHSRSARGVLRGLHYQVEPAAQGKLVRVTNGEIYDVVVDLRRASRTFGRWIAERLSAANRRMLWVPAGLAHGYCALEEGTEVQYKVTAFYSPAHERGIAWNDPGLAIEWPDLGMEYLISEKDRRYPTFDAVFHGE